ncbi:hypothetical protein TNCV_4368721 [Trichonephila clavipes]|nr:hypothetical protein TNCV_4368721 [Trichonephila clavipes]
MVREDTGAPSKGATCAWMDEDEAVCYNLRDEYSPSEPRTHENYSTGIECCKHSCQGSYSRNISLGKECYKETTVVPRPPNL